MKDLWQTAFLGPMEEFFKQVGAFIPHLLVMLIIIAIGFGVAWGIQTVISRLLEVIRFDRFSFRLGFSQALSKGGIKEHPSHLISRLVYWVIFLAFVMLGLDALNLNAINQLVSKTLSYLPHLLVALIILSVGIILGNFFGQAILIAAVNAQISQARFLALGVRLGIILFSLAMALVQLGIATTIIVAAFSISFGGVVLALAIAFGLGAKETAKAIIEKRIKKEEEPKEEELSHL
ncbi:MAG TPA: hypothetical protein VGB26_07100 [Nitrospiria bacterium]